MKTTKFWLQFYFQFWNKPGSGQKYCDKQESVVKIENGGPTRKMFEKFYRKLLSVSGNKNFKSAKECRRPGRFHESGRFRERSGNGWRQDRSWVQGRRGTKARAMLAPGLRLDGGRPVMLTHLDYSIWPRAKRGGHDGETRKPGGGPTDLYSS